MNILDMYELLSSYEQVHLRPGYRVTRLFGGLEFPIAFLI